MERENNNQTARRYVGDNNQAARRYVGAVMLLPSRFRAAALKLPEELQAVAEEIRIRAGQNITVVLPDKEIELNIAAEPEDLEILCDLATGFSRYAAAETIREGYLNVEGGYRVGLCGTAVMKDGVNYNLKDLSSAVIRIGRERKGIADKIAPDLFQNGELRNILILSPPGVGKTTLLRDIIRALSYGVTGYKPLRVALIDERGEIAVSVAGRALMDIGPRTDVLNACPKAIGVPVLLRAMNPEVIAVDEITAREDINAMMTAAGCGVKLLATIHAGSVEELKNKLFYRDLLSQNIFNLAILIKNTPDGRKYEIYNLDNNLNNLNNLKMLPDAGTVAGDD